MSWEGVVELDRNRGAKVAISAPDEVREFLIPLRRTIETFALRQCFSHLNDEDFAAWETILQRMSQACTTGDLSAIAESDLALHRSILERSNSADLLAIWQVMLSRIRRHFNATYREYDDLRTIYEEHRQLIEIFRAGELEPAVAALEQNIA